MKSISIAVSLALLAVSGTAFASAPAKVSADAQMQPPPIISKLAALSHGQIVTHFKTVLPDIEGWYLKSPAAGPKGAVLFTDGDYALVGAIVNAQGQNLTAMYLAKYAPKPSYSKVVAALAKDKAVIDLGNPKAPVHLYAFEDMNCIFCNLFYKAAEPYVESGKAYIQVVPVAFLKHSSAGKAAAVLSAANPTAAYVANEKGFNEKAEEGAAKPVSVSPTIAKELQANWNLLTQGLQMGGTPALLYQKDGKWTAFNGYSATLLGNLVAKAGK
jgi:thiol:disulfide interchange protein DsbG